MTRQRPEVWGSWLTGPDHRLPERTRGHAIFPLQMNLNELLLHGGTFEALSFWGPSSFPRHAQVKSQEENEIGQHKNPGKTCCSLGWLTIGSASGLTPPLLQSPPLAVKHREVNE